MPALSRVWYQQQWALPHRLPAALTFGNYLKAGGLPLEPRVTATGLIALLVLLHARTRRDSASGQVWLTALKLTLIALFIVLALVNTPAYSQQLFTGQPIPCRRSSHQRSRHRAHLRHLCLFRLECRHLYFGGTDNPARHLPGCWREAVLVALLYVALNGVFQRRTR